MLLWPWIKERWWCSHLMNSSFRSAVINECTVLNIATSELSPVPRHLYRTFRENHDLVGGGGSSIATKLNSVAWFRERTILTERPPLVDEVSANFCGLGVPRGLRVGSLRLFSRLSCLEPLLFFSSSSSVVLTRLNHPVPDPLLQRKSGSARNRTRASVSVSWYSDH
jgi:hypothetical protein